MLVVYRFPHNGSSMTLKKRALHVRIEFGEHVVGAVAAKVHAPIGEDAADVAVLLRIIASRNAAGYRWPNISELLNPDVPWSRRVMTVRLAAYQIREIVDPLPFRK